MIRRILPYGLCLALQVVWLSLASASELRQTPIVRAVKRAQASAINIHSEKTASADTLFAPNKSRKVNGMGTGIVIDERGYIATNHHVVKGVDVLRCTLKDGGVYTARVLTYDAAKDLAIIKIEPSRPLQIMPLGTSSDLMLGETVIAVGNAYGYEHTVTCGILSSLSRDVEVNETQSYDNLLQTDASINPGNSGGPLLNMDGDLIGINVAIRAGAQRIGFAIPIDDARETIAQLISIEQIDGNWHGLLGNSVKRADERRFEVVTTMVNSPARKAGLQAGDVVVRVGDTPIVDAVDFERSWIGVRPGETKPVVVKRDGEEKILSMSIEARDGGVKPQYGMLAVAAHDTDQESQSWKTLGLQLAKTNLIQLGSLSSRYRGGMKVTDVRTGSPADRNGIRKGDVLVGLHIWETVNAENVAYVLEHPKLNTFNPLKFYILRGSETLFGHLAIPTEISQK